MARPRGSRGHRRVREAAAARYPPGAPPPELTGVVFDSDVIIEILRGHGETVQTALALERSGIPTYCTPIASAEVYAGVRPGEEALTRAFFTARGEVVLDGGTGRHAGGYLARYARSHGVELADALVAAAVARSGFRLWTRNRKHYPMEDLRFFEPPPGAKR